MDQLIKQLLHGEIFWYETTPAAAPVSPSAFVPYSNPPGIKLGPQSAAAGCNNGVGSGNMNKRMHEFLRKSWATTIESKESEKERGFRHMMNERMRRGKQQQNFSALHSLLPIGTKHDKKSIVQTATQRVQELEWLKKDLERTNSELQTNLATMNAESNEGTKIRVRVDNPISGTDSMLEVLKCLKKMDSKPRMIQSKFTNQQFLAVMDIETEVGATQVEEAVNRKLQEAQRKSSGTWDQMLEEEQTRKI